jgi:hypothetical protein
MRALRGRFHLLLVALVLGLGLGGVALAKTVSTSLECDVTLLDGKLKASQTTFTPGKLTLVAVNQGKLTHGLAIMGTNLKPKETPAIGSGKIAKLTVTVGIGMYHIWDPVRSSMTHATMLTVKSAKAGTPTPSGGSNKSVSGGGTGGSSGGGTGVGGGMQGMDPNDPCAGM